MKKPDIFDEPIFVTRPALPAREAVYEKIDAIWDSQWVTNNGPQHRELCAKLADHLKVENLSLFCNGTLALQIACQALRLSGEVITTPFTFAATPHVLYWNNIEPVFCDIESKSYNIDPDKIESLITPRTTGILAVHTFGFPCATAAIKEIADRHGLRVIYDAAHCFGVEIGGQGICSFGDISMVSFHATKTFHTIEGGALAYSDSSMKKRIELAKNCGFQGEDTVIVPGINAKMNELQAAVGLLMLEKIDAEIEKRRLLTAVYESRLSGVQGLTTHSLVPALKHNYHNFSILVGDEFGISRDHLHERLKEYNIFSRRYFYPLCSKFQCYKHLPSSASSNLPVAERIAESVLCLPLYGGLSTDDVLRICDAIEFAGLKG